MKKKVIFICILFSFVTLIFVQNIGLSFEQIKDVYNDNITAFYDITNLMGKTPNMTVRLKKHFKNTDDRTHTYIGNLDITTYNNELNDNQILSIKNSHLQYLLTIPKWRWWKSYFVDVVMREDYILFGERNSFFTSSGLLYVKGDVIPQDFNIYDYQYVDKNWYYVNFT